jgi:hypothetical protein
MEPSIGAPSWIESIFGPQSALREAVKNKTLRAPTRGIVVGDCGETADARLRRVAECAKWHKCDDAILCPAFISAGRWILQGLL